MSVDKPGRRSGNTATGAASTTVDGAAVGPTTAGGAAVGRATIADGAAVGQLLGVGSPAGVVLGAQQRAFGGKTSDREAAGVGAPGIGAAPA